MNEDLAIQLAAAAGCDARTATKFLRGEAVRGRGLRARLERTRLALVAASTQQPAQVFAATGT